MSVKIIKKEPLSSFRKKSREPKMSDIAASMQLLKLKTDMELSAIKIKLKEVSN